MRVSSYYLQVNKMQMYLQRISVKIYYNPPTLDSLPIIELFFCYIICQFNLMKHEEQFLKPCSYDMNSINLTEDSSSKLIYQITLKSLEIAMEAYILMFILINHFDVICIYLCQKRTYNHEATI